MVLLVTRKNVKARCLINRNLVKSVCVARVVKLRKHDVAICFDVDFTANSDEGLYLRTEYKPRVPVFFALYL